MGYCLAYNIVSIFFAIIILGIGFIFRRVKPKAEHQPVPRYNYINNTKTKPDNTFERKLIDKSDVPIKFNQHILKVEKLKKEFNNKESKTKELIETKFTPPQITYDRFISIVNNCSNIFSEHYNSILNLINYGDDSTKIEMEINSEMDILQSLIDKLDDLSNELVINISKSNTDDVDDVLKDMENLISSINSYEN